MQKSAQAKGQAKKTKRSPQAQSEKKHAGPKGQALKTKTDPEAPTEASKHIQNQAKENRKK